MLPRSQKAQVQGHSDAVGLLEVIALWRVLTASDLTLYFWFVWPVQQEQHGLKF